MDKGISLLPWQHSQWERLAYRLQSGQFPHALLLRGPAGLGKSRFAEYLLNALMCSQPQADSSACGQCRGCHLVHAESHPDLRRIGPEEGSKSIKVDQIRDLCAALTLKSYFGGYQAVLIAPAEAMNAAAANGLLKTLEEPAALTILILVTDQHAALPATVRSRCHHVVFHPPAPEQAQAWLAEQISDSALWLARAGGAPLCALALATSADREQHHFMQWYALTTAGADPVALAQAWVAEKIGAVACIDQLSTWLADLIRVKMAGNAWAHNADLATELQILAQRVSADRLYAYLDHVHDLRRGLTSANEQLLLEDLFIRWVGLTGAGHAPMATC